MVPEDDRENHRHKFNGEACWSITQSLHLHTTHMRGRAVLWLNSHQSGLCAKMPSHNHIHYLLSTNRIAAKLQSLTS